METKGVPLRIIRGLLVKQRGLVDTKQRAAANQEASAKAVTDEIGRIHLKAKRIAAPKGDLYISALHSVENR